MSQAVLKLNKGYQHKSHSTNTRALLFTHEHTVLRVMFSIVILLSLVYAFTLGSMVFNIVERKSLESRAVSLLNDVSSMELEYLSLSKEIDLTYARSIGFKETKMYFTSQKSLGSASLSKNEI